MAAVLIAGALGLLAVLSFTLLRAARALRPGLRELPPQPRPEDDPVPLADVSKPRSPPGTLCPACLDPGGPPRVPGHCQGPLSPRGRPGEQPASTLLAPNTDSGWVGALASGHQVVGSGMHFTLV